MLSKPTMTLLIQNDFGCKKKCKFCKFYNKHDSVFKKNRIFDK